MITLRHALRLFLRRPLVTGVALAALSIGLAAAIAASAVVGEMLLRKPPFPSSDELVLVFSPDRKLVAPAEFHDLAASGAFTSIAAWMKWSFNLTGTTTPERLQGALVSGTFFPTLGRNAHIGRLLTPADRGDVVVISHPLWQRVFGSDPSIVGRAITLGGERVTVVGVTARDAAFPDDSVDLWTPLLFGVHFQADDRAGRNLRVIGRQIHPLPANGPLFTVPLHEEQTREIRPTLLVIFAAAAAMLLIAFANVVNLLTMLAASRRRELATRAALGASAGQLVKQTVVEGAILGSAAGVLSLTLAFFALRIAGELSLDARPALLGFGFAVVAGIAAALAASLVFRRITLAAAIRDAHQMASSGGKLRRVFVVAQVALTCALLISAAVLVKSFDRLMSVDPGFDSRNILTARVWLPSTYDTAEKQRAFFAALTDRLGRVAGVEAAATIQDLPLKGNAMSFDVFLDARETKAAYRVVSDGYFAAMRLPILRGRDFARTDDANTPRVFVINRSFARAFDGDPIGQRLRIDDDGPWGTVVGIAGDVKQMGLDGEEVPAVYQPVRQKQFDFLRWTTIVLRTTAPVTAATLRREVAAIDPNQPLFEIATVDALIRESTAKPRLTATLVGTLGAIALLVALIGIAGVLSYAVTLRTRELGIRMALGARAAELVTSVLRDAALLLGSGVAAGVLLALTTAPLLDRVLFQVAALDLAVYALVPLTVIAAGLIASIAPARRVALIDPAQTLRTE